MRNHKRVPALPIAFILILVQIMFCTPRTYADEQESLLILNSYSENEPWVISMTQPIMLYLATVPEVRCDICDLNNALVEDTTEFRALTESVISRYSSPAPKYVVMVGNLAFNMRQAIKEAWGDVPMLLITNIKDYASEDVYFDSSATQTNIGSHPQLRSLQQEYDMTAVIMPRYYKQTIELMVDLIPQIDNIVLMSDSIFSNRKMAHEIQVFLKENYPEIKFSWLKANATNAEELHRLMVTRRPNTGLLMSSWMYGKDNFDEGKLPYSGELKLIASSHNPVFAMHESYIPMGAVGGVVPYTKPAEDRALEIVKAMLDGKRLSEMPFYVCDESYPCINYRRLQSFGLKESACPPGTVFVSKPASFWDKYLWQTLAISLVVLLMVLLFMTKNIQQRRKLNYYKRNSEFVENMPIPYSTATIRYDSDDQVTTIAYDIKNAAFTRLLDDNVVPDSPFLLFPANFIAPKVTQLLKDHKPQIFMYHFKQTDTYYEFIFCLVNQTQGKRPKDQQTLDVFAIDVTNRHKMEMRFAQAMRTLDFTINVAHLVPWQFDLRRNVIIYDYHMGADQAGREAKDCEMPFEKFLETAIHPDDRDKLRNIRDDINGGRMQDFSVRLRKIDPENPGLVSWSELSGALMPVDQDEEMKGRVIGSSLDITERVRIQQEMADALERANESDRMKSAFLASMSHEIRTPLNSIIGFSNVIAHTADEDERLEFCEIINRNNEQLLALINDVLDLAKIESNSVDINYEKTDVNAMIDHVEKTASIKLPAHLRLTSIKGSNECIVELDHTRVTQILTNMISNACKFTPNGAITFGYDITDTGMIYFYVRDTGIGMSEKTRAKVFDRFFKHNTFVPGTGLGLSICKNLVEKMGGEIGAESSGEGQGSLFWFTVPYIPCTASAEDLDDHENYFFKHSARFLAERGRMKVLIAEDNESNYRLLEHLLKDTFEVVRAYNGQEAVRQFIKHEPDVVLMDISMPGMDGYTALKEIRKLSATVPVIAVTAYVYASDRPKILQFGFNGYVSKPITQKSILDAIGHTLI